MAPNCTAHSKGMEIKKRAKGEYVGLTLYCTELVPDFKVAVCRVKIFSNLW